MATIITAIDSGASAAVNFLRGETFYVKYMVPECEGLAELKREEGGSARLTFKVDCVGVVEGLHDSRKGAFHLRFVRAARIERVDIGYAEAKLWPRLRAALRHSRVPTVRALGGFHRVLAYGDEVAVPDYSMSGSGGWIVPRASVGGFLNSLPKLEDSGEIASIWIHSVGHCNTPDEWNVEIENHDPSSEEGPSYYDRPRGCMMQSNRQVFKVDFDLGSGLVKKIGNLGTGKEVRAAVYTAHPAIRTIEVGRRMPAHLVRVASVAA